MTVPSQEEGLLAWQQAAIAVFCAESPCELRRLLERTLPTGTPSVEICPLIRRTVGCPLFRGLEETPEPPSPASG